jgi:hypothetical protein
MEIRLALYGQTLCLQSGKIAHSSTPETSINLDPHA